MSLADLYSDGIEANIQNKLRNPGAEPLPSFSTWSTLGAGVAGIPAAGLEVGGSGMDILGGAVREAYSRPLPSVLRDQPDNTARRSRELEFWGVGGDVMRRKADEFAPDPRTSHAAEQAVFGLTKFAAKAVGAVAAAGPAGGAALLAAETGNTSYQRAVDKGIDPAAAQKVAAVEGVLAGVGAVLPMAGRNLMETVGLVALGGPASFMAQEGLSREILQRAGETQEAAAHDPYDPLGLLISTVVPGAFGAHGLRVRSREQAVLDAVKQIESGGKRYGKDGQLLTSTKGAQGEMQVMPDTQRDPGFGVTPARDGSPEEMARVGRDYLTAMSSRYADTDKALAAYNAGPGAVDAAVKKHGADWLDHLPDETQKYVAKANKLLRTDVVESGAVRPEVVDAARVNVLEQTVAKSLPDAPDAYANMLKASDELAAGHFPEFESVNLSRPLTELPPAADVADDLRGMGGAAYWAQQGGQMLRDGNIDDPGSGGLGNVVGRTTWIPAEEWFGRMRQDMGKGGLSSQADIQAAIEKAIAGEPLNAKQRRTVDWIRQEHDDMRRQMLADSFTPDDAAALTRDGFDAGLSSRDAGDLAATARAAEKDPDAFERAAVMHENDDAAFMAEIHRINGNDQTAQDANAGAGASREKTSGTLQGRPEAASNALPDQASVTLEPARPAPGSSGDAVVSPEARRVAELAEADPGLKVKLPGSDEVLTVGEALERAKAQAAEEGDYAQLIDAAAKCFMSFGS